MRSRWIILVCVLVSLLLHVVALLASMKVDVTVVLPKPEPKPKPERLVILLPPDPPPPPEPIDRIGEEEDKGKAINELEAPVEQRTSRELPTEQAMLSTDPVGEEPDEPTPEEPLEPAPKPEPEQAAPKAPQEAPKPQQAASQKLPEAKDSEQAQAQSETPAEDDTTPEQLAMASPPSPEPAEDKQSTPPAAPPAPKPVGDPAPEADRDSDAFSPSVSLDIVAGSVEARSGRQVKFTRPRVNLAGFVDTAVIPLPARAKMQIEIDDTGTPRRVTITRSTGSSSIDRAIELAAYQSWFEPINSLTRRDRREKFDFTLSLH
jgi:hypothetical protein